MKKVISYILSLTLFISTMPRLVLAQTGVLSLSYTFAEDTVGELPEGLDCSVEKGKIAVKDYYGTRMLNVENDADGKMAMVSKKFDAVSNTALNIKFSYMQRYVKSDGAAVFVLKNGYDEIIKFVTENGDIVSLNSDGTRTVLVEKYNANKWYEFVMTVDLAVQLFNVSVNDTNLKKLGFYTESNKCDGFCFYTRYSPGFSIADIALLADESASRIEITGSKTITVKLNQESEYTYDAIMYDDFGNEIKNPDFAWSIMPGDTEGVTVAENGNRMTIKVSPDCTYRGIMTITATAHNGADTVSGSTYVTIVTQKASEMLFEGPYTIAHDIEKDNTFILETVLKNSDGEIIDNEPVEWKIKNGYEELVTVTEDIHRVLLETKGELPSRSEIKIEAVLKSNRTIKCSRTIYTYPKDTYIKDNDRLSLLIESVDYLVNDIAKNPFNSSQAC